MQFDYRSPENHVESRPGIAAGLKPSLFAIPRDQWDAHPAFAGEARFWTEIHAGLLGASSQLAMGTRHLLSLDDAAAVTTTASQVASFAHRLVHHAHGHHHIEDHHFFPVFLRMFPQLEHPLALLDGDHKVLGEVLEEMEQAIAHFRLAPGLSEAGRRDALLKAGSVLLPAAERLDALFIRHIGDEEEICIPTMLRWEG